MWPFVGRRAELDTILRDVRDPGHGGWIVAGGPGVGKSRLAHEFAALLDGRGQAVRFVSATPATGGLAYGAFASFVPSRLSPLPSPNVLVTAVAAGMAEAPPGKRAVVIVDDAHLLDHASAAVLHHLARTGMAFVLAVVRSGEPGAGVLAPLWTEGLVERMDLAALTLADTEQVLWKALDGQPATLTVQRLHELTQGNPLLLREVVTSGLRGGVLVRVGDVWTWSGPWLLAPGLRELVQARLGDLDDAERWVLELVALSEPVGLGVITHLVGEQALLGLEQRGLLWVQQDGRRALLRVAHPLYAEALRAACPPLRTRSAKRQLSEALARTGARRRDDVLQIARWRLDAGVPVDADVLLKAARRAWTLLDLPLAERLVREALAAGFAAGDPAFMVETATTMWRVLISGERHAELLAMIDAIAAHVDLAEHLAKGLFARAETLFWGLGDQEAAMATLHGMRIDADDRWQVEEHAALSALLNAVAGRFDAAREALDTLDVEHVVNPDSAVKARVGAEVLLTFGGAQVVDERLAALVGQPVPAAAEAMPWVDPMLRLLKVQRELLMGGLDAAARAAEEAHRAALPTGWEFALMLAFIGNAQVARFEGRIDDADRWLREALALHNPRAAIGRAFHALLHGEHAHVLALAGRYEAAAEAMAVLDGYTWPSSRVFGCWADLARPWVLAARGASRPALAQAEANARRLHASGAHAAEALAWHDALRLGGRPPTERLRELAGAQGLLPDYARHAEIKALGTPAELEEVAAGFERLGRLPVAIGTYLDAAGQYADHGLADAARRCRALAATLARRCPGLAESGGVVDEFALTPREHEVARLALTGATNRRIAEDMGIAKRTVDNHLARVYAKLGIGTRDELRRFLRPDA